MSNVLHLKQNGFDQLELWFGIYFGFGISNLNFVL